MSNSFFKKGNLRFPFFVIIGLLSLYIMSQLLKTEENTSDVNLLYGTTFKLKEGEIAKTVYESDLLTVNKIQSNFKNYPVYKYISNSNYDIYILMSLSERKDKFDTLKVKTFGKSINKTVKSLYYTTKNNKEFIALLTSNDSNYTIPKSLLYERFKEN